MNCNQQCETTEGLSITAFSITTTTSTTITATTFNWPTLPEINPG